MSAVAGSSIWCWANRRVGQRRLVAPPHHARRWWASQCKHCSTYPTKLVRPRYGFPRSLAKSEVGREAAPGAVDVVRRVPRRVGLDVQELDHEGWPLDAVAVRLARLRRPGVGEVQVPRAGVVHPLLLG